MRGYHFESNKGIDCLLDFHQTQPTRQASPPSSSSPSHHSQVLTMKHNICMEGFCNQNCLCVFPDWSFSDVQQCWKQFIYWFSRPSSSWRHCCRGLWMECKDIFTLWIIIFLTWGKELPYITFFTFIWQIWMIIVIKTKNILTGGKLATGRLHKALCFLLSLQTEQSKYCPCKSCLAGGFLALCRFYFTLTLLGISIQIKANSLCVIQITTVLPTKWSHHPWTLTKFLYKI